MKALHSICQQIWKTQQWPKDWKRSVFIPIPKKGNAKEYSNYCTVSLISHTIKVCSKLSNPGFSNMWTVNFQMFKLVLEKAEEPEIKLPTSIGSPKKQENSRKTSTPALLTMPKLWLCGSQQTVENSSRYGNTRHLNFLLRNLYAGQEATVRTGHGTATGSKFGKEYIKAVYCHPAYLTYMQSTSFEMLGWMKHKLESRLPREISITSDMQMTPTLWQKAKN